MAIRLPRILQAKQVLRKTNMFSNQSTSIDVPKGYLAIYVTESQKKRFVIPISFLNKPSFREFYVWLRKNSDRIIQWEVSQFPALKTCSLISLLSSVVCHV
ncbi:hypothetical protein Q3G72_031209 [Acer saccharum]|nr:hypothetical protein Q3G72_031209 [Acer saccharum]